MATRCGSGDVAAPNEGMGVRAGRGACVDLSHARPRAARPVNPLLAYREELFRLHSVRRHHEVVRLMDALIKDTATLHGTSSAVTVDVMVGVARICNELGLVSMSSGNGVAGGGRERVKEDHKNIGSQVAMLYLSFAHQLNVLVPVTLNNMAIHFMGSGQPLNALRCLQQVDWLAHVGKTPGIRAPPSQANSADDVALHAMLNMATVLSSIGRDHDAIVAAKCAVQLAEHEAAAAQRELQSTDESAKPMAREKCDSAEELVTAAYHQLAALRSRSVQPTMSKSQSPRRTLMTKHGTSEPASGRPNHFMDATSDIDALQGDVAVQAWSQRASSRKPSPQLRRHRYMVGAKRCELQRSSSGARTTRSVLDDPYDTQEPGRSGELAPSRRPRKPIATLPSIRAQSAPSEYKNRATPPSPPTHELVHRDLASCVTTQPTVEDGSKLGNSQHRYMASANRVAQRPMTSCLSTPSAEMTLPPRSSSARMAFVRSTRANLPAKETEFVSFSIKSKRASTSAASIEVLGDSHWLNEAELKELRSGTEFGALHARAKLAKEYRDATPEQRRVLAISRDGLLVARAEQRQLRKNGPTTLPKAMHSAIQFNPED